MKFALEKLTNGQTRMVDANGEQLGQGDADRSILHMLALKSGYPLFTDIFCNTLPATASRRRLGSPLGQRAMQG